MIRRLINQGASLRRSVSLLTICACLSAPAIADQITYADETLDRETLLLSSLGDLQQNQLNGAVDKLKTLIDEQPDFRLAQLIYADLMAAQGAPLSAVGNNKTDADAKTLNGLIKEAQARMNIASVRPDAGLIPSSLIKMSDDQEHVIVIDISSSRLYLFENQQGVPVLINDYYVSYGRGGVNKRIRGDLKTPLGVYFTTSRLSDEQLPARYGSGALPINYPNVWDVRHGYNGSGIWLHGSPKDTFSRPPQASEGCLSLTNQHFSELDGIVDFDATPVLLGTNFEWVERQDWLDKQTELVEVVNGWRDDWQSLNTDKFVSHYSRDFDNGKEDYKRFVAHKRRVNAAKSYIDVGIENLSLYQYPDQPDLLVASFEQNYSSNNYNGSSIKRQYWVKQDGKWKIAYEGAPSKGIP
ncbi:L,D-transpeptidase family protein [Aliamphritea ceti]|uniref:L,D-transpeptidase family protein n=1 Tax=Aliamphritea ceti TaxID=1524258 RepID=UPI0021C416D7|nr:L,D-transpeptidase family protein [Aliamphritea ceti]